MKAHKGFTLLESLVAIYVLLVGIVGAMTLTQQNIAAANVFRNELIAANLAQEGVELVRNKMTTNFLTATNNSDPACVNGSGRIDCNVKDMTGMLTTNPPFAPCGTTNGCYPDFDPITSTADVPFVDCLNSTECKKLNQGASSGIFSTFAGNPQSQFDRRIKITTVPNGWDVVVTISWQGRFGPTKLQERAVLAPWFF